MDSDHRKRHHRWAWEWFSEGHDLSDIGRQLSSVPCFCVAFWVVSDYFANASSTGRTPDVSQRTQESSVSLSHRSSSLPGFSNTSLGLYTSTKPVPPIAPLGLLATPSNICMDKIRTINPSALHLRPALIPSTFSPQPSGLVLPILINLNSKAKALPKRLASCSKTARRRMRASGTSSAREAGEGRAW